VTRVNPQTSIGEGLPVIHWDFDAETDYLDILMMPKGSGSENMSAMKMFIPADGVAAVKKFIIDTVIASGANPCPPGIIGVGIGGTADLVMSLAKKALTRPVGSRNHDSYFAALEEELEEAINSTGIGPMGLGGVNTTLAVHIEWAYTHITQNPVAVNTQCWPARRARAKIWADGRVEYGF
jgi:fumarate hydratase subunit alpha/L(+)-tartrate dehydratase alpha subunit